MYPADDSTLYIMLHNILQYLQFIYVEIIALVDELCQFIKLR